MQSATISLVLLTSVIVSGYHTGAKLRRDGVLNLYPFPRVGRSSPRTWQVPLSLRDLYYDYETVDKRQLYAFPRVGRSESKIYPREGEEKEDDDPGMWFGPRLGRAGNTVPVDMMFKNKDRSEPELLVPENNVERIKRKAN